MQCEPPTLLFISSPFVRLYYSGLSVRCSAADQTNVWTIALTELVFIFGATFSIKGKDVAWSTYYTENIWLDYLSEGILVRLLVKILVTVVYFGLYKFSLRMESDPVLMALGLKRSIKKDWGRTPTRDGFVC